MADGDIVIEVNFYVLIVRLFIAATCLVIVTFIIVWGYTTSIHKGPTFVKALVGMIALTNLAGVCFSYSMINRSIYDNAATFGIQFTFMAVYWGCQLITYW